MSPDRPHPTRRRLSGLVTATAAVAALALVTGSSSASAALRHYNRRAVAQVLPASPVGQHVAFGAFAPGLPSDLTGLTALGSALGGRLSIASSYSGWGDLLVDAGVRGEAAAGYTPLVSWDLGATASTRFTTFTAHAHDTYLAQVAAAARSLGRPLYVRPWPEMNADWVPFQPTGNGTKPAGGTPAQFIAAWRYLVTFFRSHGATNVKWVFNPTTDTYAGTTSVSTIWPGASYVDVLGLDGYNWGTDSGWGRWQSFHDIYATQYTRLVRLHRTAPVWVCEFGSKEPTEDDGSPVDPTHSKARWYADLLADTAFPRVSALVFFDVHKERDWRLASDPGAVAAVAAVRR